VLNLKSKKESLFSLLSNETFLKGGVIGGGSYLLYLSLYILLSLLILDKVEYFSDYGSYSLFVDHGVPQLIYREPLSWLSMTLISWLNLTAKEYYIFSWVFVSLLVFMLPLFLGRRYIVFSVVLLINPFTLILFQTPRSFMAFPFYVLMVVLVLKSRVFFSMIAIMFHNLSGFYMLFLLYISKFRIIFFIILLFMMLAGMFILVQLFYPYYDVKVSAHGQGRLQLFILFTMTLIAISIKKSNNNILLLLSICLFTVLSYEVITPAARLIPYLFTVILLYSFNMFKKIDSIIVVHILYISYILISFYVVISGRFGFG
jgi:hypothetical protein